MWRRKGLAVFFTLSGIIACGESDSPTAVPDGEQDSVATELPNPDTGPVADCTDQSGETPCDDGDPCTAGDTCDGQGSCVGATSTVCLDQDNNPCTQPQCDAETGDPAQNYCVEVPLVSETVDDSCTQTECTDGEVTNTAPSDQNDCAEWLPPTDGCIDHYVCDLSHTAPNDGSHCRPVFRPDGALCHLQGVGVKAAAHPATINTVSTCDLYVCHQPIEPDTPLGESECVLSSTLPQDIQDSLEVAGNALTHPCYLEDVPESINAQCNQWRCGCKDEGCTEPECQVSPAAGMAGKACNNGNQCDASVCSPSKEGGAFMSCEDTTGTEKACDLFPSATCDVTGPCDPQTGCPTTMDVDTSNANCLINNACIDTFNTKCAPNDPNADPNTGCVVVFQNAGTPCTDALKDSCVQEASCQPVGESMKCEVTQWVNCDDGNDCTNNFCADGQCQATNLPGKCEDGNACTINDSCQDGTCQGGDDLNCDNGLFCDGKETCDTTSGCVSGKTPNPNDGIDCTLDECSEEFKTILHTPDHTLCDNNLFCDGQETCVPFQGCVKGTVPAITDLVGCTIDYCDEDNNKVVHTPDDNACDNGLFCDGQETCHLMNGCQNGTVPAITDLVGCTIDYCDEDNNEVVHTPDDNACDNGLFCDGQETCAPTSGCESGQPLQCDDSDACNGLETCDDATGCQNGEALDCNDNDPCTDDACQSPGGTCVFVPNDGTCPGGQCVAGDCVPDCQQSWYGWAGIGTNNGWTCADVCAADGGTTVDWDDLAEQQAYCHLLHPNAVDFVHETSNLSYPIWEPQENRCKLNANGAKSQNYAGNGTTEYGDQILCKCENMGCPKCGNGTIEGDEQCDDDNTTDGDGCSSTCETEATSGPCDNWTGGLWVDGLWWQEAEITAGASCLGKYYTHAQAKAACDAMGPDWSLPTIGQANALLDHLSAAQEDQWFPLIGNGGTNCTQMQAGGNGVWWLLEHNGQVAGASLLCNSGSCYTTGTQMGDMYLYRARCVKATCETGCGNGQPEPGETCDDGNNASGDGCSATCSAEAPSLTCTDAATTWTVPNDTPNVIRIEARGAQGGSRLYPGNGHAPASGGLGAVVSGCFQVSAGQVLNISVGCQGGDGLSPWQGGGGGGGTFVARNGEVLLIAGGGGGADAYQGIAGQPGLVGEAGGPGWAGSTGPVGHGGTNPGSAGGNGGGGGGGGWLSDGNGSSLVNGGKKAGGPGVDGIYGGDGGFGGGGSSYHGGGGGGGYSGGSGGMSEFDGSSNDHGGGGGGSKNTGGSPLAEAGVQAGDGAYKISYNGCNCETVVAGSTVHSKVSAAPNITLTAPSGTGNGSLLIAAITTNYHADVKPPNGWTLVEDGKTAGNCGSQTFSHVVTASSPNSHTFLFQNELTHASAVITTFQNVDPKDPIDASSQTVTNGYTANAVSTSADNGLFVLALSSGNSANTWSAPSGWSPGYHGGQSATSTGIFTRAQPNAGSSGNVTSIASVGDMGHAHLIALRAACQ